MIGKIMALVRKRNKKVAEPAPIPVEAIIPEPVPVEPDAALHTGGLHGACAGESPESHPHKFDTFGNPH